MAIIKCKMCGGDLILVENQSVAECEYCGTRQTVPSADNDKKIALFGRANRLRFSCEFDKAAGIYETILADFPEESEAYWGLVLCKYGIEYVDDPATGRKIPTCHRSSFDSVMKDENFEQAMENADDQALRVYRQEAKQIETVRMGILQVSSSEKPYDIFICYKETDSSGNRTVDSLLAQDLYDALTAKGYRVFFSRITLEDKLGQAYEPYIFAALNSAKIMLAVGTCYEHYNAVWVKNEWSRYLKIIAQDKNKYLIPCYKNIDPYDIPSEFAHLQGQDLGKVGGVADLLRGVEKLLPKKAETRQETVVVQKSEKESSTEPLLRRAFLFLEDGNWSRADEYCEKVLDMVPESAMAYLGKLLAELRVHRKEDLVNCTSSFAGNDHYKKVLRFAEPALKTELEKSLDYVVSVMETKKSSHIENGVLKRYKGSQRHVVIPGTVTGIAKDAFSGCGNLETVVIPDSVTEIGAGAFSDCEKLAEIRLSPEHPCFRTVGTCLIHRKTQTLLFGKNFPDMPTDGSIRRIGESAFRGNEAIADIRIPEGITHIENGAFTNCRNLCSVVLPRSIVAIAATAFPHNPGIRLIVSEDHPIFRLAGSCLIHAAEKTAIFGTSISDLPQDGSVTAIGDHSFAGCELPDSLVIPECIVRIGANAFSGCKSPVSMTFFGKNLKIAENAFDWTGKHLTVYAFSDSDAAQWARKNRIATEENAEMKRLTAAALLKQGNRALEAGEWSKAAGFFENVIKNDSRNAQAYLGKALVQDRCHTLGALAHKRQESYRTVTSQTLHLKEDTDHIQKMVEQYTLPGFVDENTIRALYRFDLSYQSEVSGRQKQYLEAASWWKNNPLLSSSEKLATGDLAQQLQQEKTHFLAQMNAGIRKAQEAESLRVAKLKAAYEAHIAQADKQAEQLYNDALALRQKRYEDWQNQAAQETNPQKLTALAQDFTNLGDYLDSPALAEHCRQRAAEEQEKIRLEKERQRQMAAEKKKPRKRLIRIVAIVCALCILLTGPVYQLFTGKVLPELSYREAESLLADGQYEEAIAAFEAMNGYKDSNQKIQLCYEGIQERSYLEALALKEQEAYAEAIAAFKELGDYKDCAEQITACLDASEELTYQTALELMEAKDFEAAMELLLKVKSYKDSKALIRTCEAELAHFQKEAAVALMLDWRYDEAVAGFKTLDASGIDCKEEILKCELAMLTQKRRTPYVTIGQPIGNEVNVSYSLRGSAKVHSFTRVELDNGCVRFTLDCTMPESEFVLFYDSSHGHSQPQSRFWYQINDETIPAGNRVFAFDVRKEDISATNEMTIKFGYTGSQIAVWNPY